MSARAGDDCVRRPARPFELLPEDLFPSLASHVEPMTVASLAAASRAFPAFSRCDEAWRLLALSWLWPRDAALNELLASGRAFPECRAASGPGLASSIVQRRISWRGLFKAHKAAAGILVVDVGYGYTKFAFPPSGGGSPPAPGVLQLCSSPTHPADAQRQHQLAAVAQRSASVGRAAESPARPGGRLARGLRAAPVASAHGAALLPAALLALMAHGACGDGLVVNIGQREVVLVPCLDGQVCYEAIRTQEGMGASRLTQVMLDLLMARGDGVDWSMLTWCRDLKDKHCQVAPQGYQLGPQGDEGGDGAGVDGAPSLPPPVEVSTGRLRIVLDAERFLVPEVLFRGRAGLPSLVMSTVLAVAKMLAGAAERSTVAARLLSSIVVVGGTAELPGLHA
eukprot:CAMPEP_0170258816 /NCGR_PEP_ID=MMETSP0116_2-20130129/29278_1 /TAXON_ID=400756 /ORGANISM="Durinskia baltica, Strain CSIRO CS-38" /LENGTH=395 /DNA_ID=CAMNT_0010509859 /DNA_START=78 /DNA_END=1263 /DNA_ORIENTATION=-